MLWLILTINILYSRTSLNHCSYAIYSVSFIEKLTAKHMTTDLLLHTFFLVIKMGILFFIPVLVYSPKLLGKLAQPWQYTLLIFLVIICTCLNIFVSHGLNFSVLDLLYIGFLVIGDVMILRGFHKGKYPNLNKYFKEIGIGLLALAVLYPLVISSLL